MPIDADGQGDQCARNAAAAILSIAVVARIFFCWLCLPAVSHAIDPLTGLLAVTNDRYCLVGYAGVITLSPFLHRILARTNGNARVTQVALQ